MVRSVHGGIFLGGRMFLMEEDPEFPASFRKRSEIK